MSADNSDTEDCDTEDYEGPGSSSSDELRYLEADEAWDNYAQTCDLPTSPRDYTLRVCFSLSLPLKVQCVAGTGFGGAVAGEHAVC